MVRDIQFNHGINIGLRFIYCLEKYIKFRKKFLPSQIETGKIYLFKCFLYVIECPGADYFNKFS